MLGYLPDAIMPESLSKVTGSKVLLGKRGEGSAGQAAGRGRSVGKRGIQVSILFSMHGGKEFAVPGKDQKARSSALFYIPYMEVSPNQGYYFGVPYLITK